jgi:hypothetical protein
VNGNWVPTSAAALVTGAIALLLGAQLLPDGGEGAASTLMVVRENDARWFGASLLFLLGGVGILIGLPCLLGLFRRRGRGIGITALGVMGISCAGTVGFAMLLVFVRALVLEDGLLQEEAFDEVVSDAGLNAVLYGWIATFYLAELLLAIAVLRARSAPRWIPGLLLLHVLLFPVSDFLPHDLASASVVLYTLGLCGLAITANNSVDQAYGATASAVTSRTRSSTRS